MKPRFGELPDLGFKPQTGLQTCWVKLAGYAKPFQSTFAKRASVNMYEVNTCQRDALAVLQVPFDIRYDLGALQTTAVGLSWQFVTVILTE